ncbi:hypothetical protein IAU60_002252 [Kwoniella sp. DSM 27419]
MSVPSGQGISQHSENLSQEQAGSSGTAEMTSLEAIIQRIEADHLVAMQRIEAHHLNAMQRIEADHLNAMQRIEAHYPIAMQRIAEDHVTEMQRRAEDHVTEMRRIRENLSWTTALLEAQNDWLDTTFHSLKVEMEELKQNRLDLDERLIKLEERSGLRETTAMESRILQDEQAYLVTLAGLLVGFFWNNVPARGSKPDQQQDKKDNKAAAMATTMPKTIGPSEHLNASRVLSELRALVEPITKGLGNPLMSSHGATFNRDKQSCHVRPQALPVFERLPILLNAIDTNAKNTRANNVDALILLSFLLRLERCGPGWKNAPDYRTVAVDSLLCVLKRGQILSILRVLSNPRNRYPFIPLEQLRSRSQLLPRSWMKAFNW